MTTAGPPHPTQVLSQRLPGTPAQVWARGCHSGFIGNDLGASLPALDWAAAAAIVPATVPITTSTTTTSMTTTSTTAM